MQLYHGSHNGSLVAHEGLCLTSRVESAEHYAQRDGSVYSVQIADDLVIEDCPGYDWETDHTPADKLAYRAAAAARGVDVLRYMDADERGNQHDCYRLVSDKAVASVVIVEMVAE
jgi:hypothetical protein